MVLETLNPLCLYSIEAKTITHYFLCCCFYNANRYALINKLSEIDSSFFTLNENKFIDLILYGSEKFDKSNHILMLTIKFIKDYKDFTKTCYNYFHINVKLICVLFMCIF